MLLARSCDRVLAAVREHRANLLRPPLDVDEYLAALQRQDLHATVALLRAHTGRF